ncbi:MAG: endonuclease/exonuclease/phosphatase family protein [Pirellulaceae bacterium]|nr:endonuclease/exonuclease/phosphatase family protein [Pirellulaceae bacterium]
MNPMRIQHNPLFSASLPLTVFLIVLVISLAGRMFPLGVASGQERPFRIVAFNVENLAAPRSRASKLQRYRWDMARLAHAERIATLIETLSPDLVNLEEVTSREALDLLVSILEEKGLNYHGYHVESADTYTGFDIAVLSRIPLDKVSGEEIHLLTSSDPQDSSWKESYVLNGEVKTTGISRNALYYLTVNNQKIGFLGLHLIANPDNHRSNMKRSAQAKIVARAVRDKIVAKGYHPIVLGDFNDYDPAVEDANSDQVTKTDVLATIKNYDQTTPEDELINVAQKIKRLKDRYTSHWDRNENGHADSEDLFTMIDHILIPKEWEARIDRAFICHTLDLTTSDHFPVVVDLLLK